MPASARSRSTKRSTSKHSAGRKCSSARSRSNSRSAASKSKRASARKRVGRSKRRSSAARRRSSARARRSRSTYARSRSASGHRRAASRRRSSSRAQHSRKAVDVGKETRRGRSVLRGCASSRMASKSVGTGRGRSVTWAANAKKIPYGKSRSPAHSLSSRATAVHSSSASRGVAEPKKKGPCYSFAAFVKEQLTNTSIAKGTLCATMRCLAARWALLTPEQKEKYRKMARELSAANQSSLSAMQKRVAGKPSRGCCGGRRTPDDNDDDED